jgi:uncharacterized protein (TIRG00374 family)
MTGRRRHYLLIAQILISVALLGLLIHFAQPEKLWAALENISPTAMALASAAMIACNVTAAFRQSVILRSLGIDVSLRRMIVLNWMGLFANNFLPSSVGGDAAIAAFLQRRHQRLGTIVTGLLINRISGLVALLIMLLVLLLVVDIGPLQSLVNRLILWSIGLLALGIAGIGLLFLLHRTGNQLSRLIVVIFAKLQLVGTAAQSLSQHFCLIFISSVVTMALMVTAVGVLGLSQYPPASFWSTITIFLMLQLVQLVPISFNGIGMAESLITYCLAQVGWPLQDAVLFGLVVRAVMIVVSLPGALAFLFLPADMVKQPK